VVVGTVGTRTVGGYHVCVGVFSMSLDVIFKSEAPNK
jgi:hypothetical protein